MSSTSTPPTPGRTPCDPSSGVVWEPPNPLNDGGCLGHASRNGAGVTGIAASVRGARVLHSVSWFQAQALCANAGKRLCTNEEWQVAAAGTPDEGEGALADCNINNILPTIAAGEPDDGWLRHSDKRYRAGASSRCMSNRGVYDLVGNVYEWVAWWSPAGQANTNFVAENSKSWPNPSYNGDATTNLNSRAYDPHDEGGSVDGLPGAGLRGGDWNDGTQAGAFSVNLYFAPSDWHDYPGFRCCRGGL